MADAIAHAGCDAAENSGASGERLRGGEQVDGGVDQREGGADPDADATEDEEDGADAGAAMSTTTTSALSSSSAAARRPVAFQSAHALKFGLEVVARDAATSPPRVTAVLCLFCKHFGREPKAGAKRRATTNFKYFKGVFRTDQYLQHHRLQHPTKWADYDAASVREKQTFFPRYLMATDATTATTTASDSASDETYAKPKAAKKLRRGASDAVDEREDSVGAVRSMFTTDNTTQFAIPTQIVALLLGDQQWQPRSLPLCERGKATDDRSDELMLGPATTSEAVETQEVYRGSLPDRLSFDMAVDLLGATGLSPVQATRTLQAMAKYVPSGAALASVWDDLVENYAQVATLGSLTLLSTLMASSWAFSIGFYRHDDANDVVEVRVRCFHSTLHDFHLCYLHVASATEKLRHVLRAVYPNWSHTLLGISVAGDVFASAALSPTIQSLCAAAAPRETVWTTWNSLDLLQRAFFDLFHQLQGGAFAETFSRLQAYVKSQSRLIQEIGHEAQHHDGSANNDEAVAEIVAISRWFTEKRVRIRKYFEEDSERSSSKPSESWWLCLAIFDWIATPTEQTVRNIRVRCGGLAPAEQFTLLKELETDIASAFRVSNVGHTSDTAAVATNAIQYISTQGACVTTKTGMLEFIVELGSFVNSLLTSFHHDELDVVLAYLGTSVASFVGTLQTGQSHGHDFVKSCGFAFGAEADSVATSLSMLPPAVLPQEIVKLSGKDLSALLHQYRQQLRTRFSDEDLDTMEQEHQALRRAIREKDFRAWASEMPTDRLAQFDGAWLKTTGRFRTLHAFVGGLATVLPRDAGRRKQRLRHEDSNASAQNESLMTVMDMKTEASRHAAQFHELQRLWRLTR